MSSPANRNTTRAPTLFPRPRRATRTFRTPPPSGTPAYGFSATILTTVARRASDSTPRAALSRPVSPQRFAGGPRQEQRRRQWRLSQWRPDRQNQAALWTVTSTARITPSSPASPRAGRHLHRLGPRPSVANDRLRHMLIGNARVSKVDGSQSLDLQSGVSFLWTPVQLLTASTLHRRTRSTPCQAHEYS